MRKWLIVLTVVVVLAASGVLVVRHHLAQVRARERTAAMVTGRAFLAAWNAKRYDQLGALTASDPDAGESFRLLASRLKATSVRASETGFSPDGKRMQVHVIAALDGLGQLGWDNQIRLVTTRGGARVAFTSSTVFPGLVNGQVLSRSAPLVTRGDIEDRHGRSIRAASADLAANVLGRSTAPKTGLEQLYDTQLTGTSGGTVQVVDRGSGQVVRVVKTFPPRAPRPIVTTLDLGVQAAAESALARAPGRAALVVVDSATGEIRAVANQPVAGLPAAFRSEAPGSTFKVLVALAALQHGFTPSTQVDCPAKVVKGGKAFTNDEPMPSRMTLQEAFARSCNTAFINVADTFPKGTLRSIAPTLGFERGPLLPTGADGGTIPEPASSSEAYADVIGQGRVEASPLLMASVAAAVASGTWHRPHLDPRPADASPLPAPVLPALRQMMAAVVTSGTAARAGLPPGTRGKTGTAEYGESPPYPTHAWFMGYRGGLAFCVYVETGESGGRTAAPIAAAFLRSV